MSKADSWENALLSLVLNNVNAANIGDATGLRGSTAAGSLYLSLHTGDPGEAGSQTTNETAYTGYARVALARDGTQWVVASGTATLQSNKDFGICTAAPGTAITHIGVGTASSGAGTLLYSEVCSPNITMAVNVIPRIPSGSTISEG